ncbi:hypothetical protein HK098_005358 [Nowakowskiella sp. JEL0407]|nr:hypothetical protein HK098_005358 [Nowakowskiella sp. JEL0407]
MHSLNRTKSPPSPGYLSEATTLLAKSPTAPPAQLPPQYYQPPNPYYIDSYANSSSTPTTSRTTPHLPTIYVTSPTPTKPPLRKLSGPQTKHLRRKSSFRPNSSMYEDQLSSSDESNSSINSEILPFKHRLLHQAKSGSSMEPSKMGLGKVGVGLSSEMEQKLRKTVYSGSKDSDSKLIDRQLIVEQARMNTVPGGNGLFAWNMAPSNDQVINDDQEEFVYAENNPPHALKRNVSSVFLTVQKTCSLHSVLSEASDVTSNVESMQYQKVANKGYGLRMKRSGEIKGLRKSQQQPGVQHPQQFPASPKRRDGNTRYAEIANGFDDSQSNQSTRSVRSINSVETLNAGNSSDWKKNHNNSTPQGYEISSDLYGNSISPLKGSTIPGRKRQERLSISRPYGRGDMNERTSLFNPNSPQKTYHSVHSTYTRQNYDTYYIMPEYEWRPVRRAEKKMTGWKLTGYMLMTFMLAVCAAYLLGLQGLSPAIVKVGWVNRDDIGVMVNGRNWNIGKVEVDGVLLDVKVIGGDEELLEAEVGEWEKVPIMRGWGGKNATGVIKVEGLKHRKLYAYSLEVKGKLMYTPPLLRWMGLAPIHRTLLANQKRKAENFWDENFADIFNGLWSGYVIEPLQGIREKFGEMYSIPVCLEVIVEYRGVKSRSCFI